MTATRVRVMLGAVVALVGGMALPFAAANDAVPIASPTTPPTLTPPADIGVLDANHLILTFTGGVTNPTPFPLVNVPVAAVCEVTCQEFTFTATDATPFLVSVKDDAGSVANGWDLALYDPFGRAVAAANGIGANGQAVRVDAPRAGTYTIVVTYTFAEDPNATYHGEVRALTGTAWSPAPATCHVTVGSTTGCFLLPELRAFPASDLHVTGLPPVASTPLGYPFPVDVPTTSSCYADESYSLASPSPDSVTHPVRRCLRFTSDVVNVGAGTLLIGIPWATPEPASGFVPGGCHAQQVVRTVDGTEVLRPAGDCEFHPAHGHFHYRDLVSFTLYTLDQYNHPDAPAAASLKESFCLVDDDYFGFGTAGPNGPRVYVGQPDCNVPARIGPDGVTVDEGISPGWGDVYTWDTPDQFIDISTVAPGNYALVERTNPSNTLLVSGDTQTCSVTILHLDDVSVSTVSTDDSITCP